MSALKKYISENKTKTKFHKTTRNVEMKIMKSDDKIILAAWNHVTNADEKENNYPSSSAVSM